MVYSDSISRYFKQDILEPEEVSEAFLALGMNDDCNSKFLRDDSPNHLKGILKNGAFGVGHYGHAVYLTGNNSYIEVPARGRLRHGNSFYVSFFMKVPAPSEGTMFSRIDDNQNGYELKIIDNIIYFSTDGGKIFKRALLPKLNDDDHYYLIYFGSEGVTFYRDFDFYGEIPSQQIIEPRNNLLIGKSHNENEANFKGVIDEFRIYSDIEDVDTFILETIRERFEPIPCGEVFHYSFDNYCSADFANDDSFNHNSGILNNFNETSEGYDYSGLKFDLNDQYIQTNPSETLKIDNGITFEAFFKSSSSNKMMLIDVDGTDQNSPRFYGLIDDGKFVFYFDNNTGQNKITSKTIINDDNWHHLAVTVSKSGLIKLFVDGSLEKQNGNNEPDLESNIENDTQCGEGERITICHFPPGNPDNRQTIEVNSNALSGHLDHGDTCGPCPDDETSYWTYQGGFYFGKSNSSLNANTYRGIIDEIIISNGVKSQSDIIENAWIKYSPLKCIPSTEDDEDFDDDCDGEPPSPDVFAEKYIDDYAFGEISIPEKANLEIPYGAVHEGDFFSISIQENPDETSIKPNFQILRVVSLEPSGYQFDSPVILKINFSQIPIREGFDISNIGALITEDENEFNEIPVSVDIGSRLASIQLDHFTDIHLYIFNQQQSTNIITGDKHAHVTLKAYKPPFAEPIAFRFRVMKKKYTNVYNITGEPFKFMYRNFNRVGGSNFGVKDTYSDPDPNKKPYPYYVDAPKRSKTNRQWGYSSKEGQAYFKLKTKPKFYWIMATHGPGFSVDIKLIGLSPGQHRIISFSLEKKIDPEKGRQSFIEMDTHVHTVGSKNDEYVMRNTNKMLSLLSARLDYYVNSDHGKVYTGLLNKLKYHNLEHHLLFEKGAEFSNFKRHSNVWPLQKSRLNSAFNIDLEVFNNAVRWMYALADNKFQPKIIQVNHPLAKKGYWKNVGLDAETGDRSNNKVYDPRYNVITAYTGLASHAKNLKVINKWLGLLNLGYRYTAVGASDAHRGNEFHGQPRSYVFSNKEKQDIRQAIMEHKVSVGNGLFLNMYLTKPNGKSPVFIGEQAKAKANRYKLTLEIQGSNNWLLKSNLGYKVFINRKYNNDPTPYNTNDDPGGDGYCDPKKRPDCHNWFVIDSIMGDRGENGNLNDPVYKDDIDILPDSGITYEHITCRACAGRVTHEEDPLYGISDDEDIWIVGMVYSKACTRNRSKLKIDPGPDNDYPFFKPVVTSDYQYPVSYNGSKYLRCPFAITNPIWIDRNKDGVWTPPYTVFDGSAKQQRTVDSNYSTSIGSEFLVNRTNTQGVQRNGVSATDRYGNTFYVYMNDYGLDNNHTIKGTLYNYEGQLVKANIPIAENDDLNHKWPRVDINNIGQVIVTWQAKGFVGPIPSQDIYIKGYTILTDDDNKASAIVEERTNPIRINDFPLGPQEYPDVAIADPFPLLGTLNNTFFMVVWQDDRDENGKYEIFGMICSWTDDINLSSCKGTSNSPLGPGKNGAINVNDTGQQNIEMEIMKIILDGMV
ncbi:MAG: LamG-like jellyroll fold domain-containing protein [Candidatus Hodarchaeales archaeon]